MLEDYLHKKQLKKSMRLDLVMTCIPTDNSGRGPSESISLDESSTGMTV